MHALDGRSYSSGGGGELDFSHLASSHDGPLDRCASQMHGCKAAGSWLVQRSSRSSGRSAGEADERAGKMPICSVQLVGASELRNLIDFWILFFKENGVSATPRPEKSFACGALRRASGGQPTLSGRTYGHPP